VSDVGRKNHVVGAGDSAISAVRFSQGLTAAIDTWAEAHHLNRADAIRLLVEFGLKVAPAPRSHGTVRENSSEIEDQAISRINALLDPLLPADERERRIRRLIEGPPEFAEQRVDLPKRGK